MNLTLSVFQLHIQICQKTYCINYFRSGLLNESTLIQRLFHKLPDPIVTVWVRTFSVSKLKHETVEVGWVELVSKELNHLAAILHVYAWSLNFMKLKEFFCYYFSKRKWKYFYTFYHFYSENLKVFKKSKIAQIYYCDPESARINLQSPQSDSTPWTLTLWLGLSSQNSSTMLKPDVAYSI